MAFQKREAYKLKDSKKCGAPLVYSCSGCSSAAQMANYIAVKMDRSGVAEMSCIAGVGGGVKSLVLTAQSGRPLIAIDGCPLKCVEQCLKRHNLAPDVHVVLSDYNIKKRYHADFDQDEAEKVFNEVVLRTGKAKAG